MTKTARKYFLRTFAYVFGFWKIYKERVLLKPLLPQEINSQALGKIYSHAKKNIPYYRENLPQIDPSADILPSFRNLQFVLEKQVLKENISQLMDPRVAKSASILNYNNHPVKSLAKLLFKRNVLIPVSTGGSTGSPLRFFKTKEDGVKMLLTLLQIARFHGWQEGETLLSIWQEGMYSQLAFLRKILGIFGFPLFIFKQMNEKSAEDFLQTLNLAKPAVLFSFPSYLTELIVRLKAKNSKIGHQPKFILCAGEMLFDHQRELMESFFNCKVYQFYGSMEIGFVAAECPGQHGLHTLEDYAFLENDNSGNILATPLDMYYMPLIKYQTKDRGTVTAEGCPCGIHGRKVIGVLEGRTEEFLINGKGEKVYASYLRQLLLEFNEKYDNLIVRGQFVQKKNKDLIFSLQLMTVDDGNAQLADALSQRLNKDLGVKVYGKIVKELFQEEGKFKFLIRE